MGTVAVYLEAVALVVLIAAFVWQIWNLKAISLPPMAAGVPSQTLPPLSVVLTAGQDPTRVEACLGSLLTQDYPNLELIVASTGPPGTRPPIPKNLTGDPRLRVAPGVEPGPGWTKNDYIRQGVFKATRHDWILFMDDSMLLRPDALRRVVAKADWSKADVLTLLPELTARTLWERCLLPFIVQLNLLFVRAHAVNDPKRPEVAGHESFMLFRRVAYEAVGGHMAVRGESTDGLALPRRLKAGRGKALFVLGVELAVLETQTGLWEIWQSWQRSFYSAVSGSLQRALLAACVIVAIFAAPWLLMIPALLLLRSPIGTSPWMGVLIFGAANVVISLTMRMLLRDVLRMDNSLAWMQPAAALMMALMIVGSTVHFEGFASTWADRLTRAVESIGQRG